MPIDPKTLKGNWNYPTRIWFGPGRIAELAEACASLGITRPLIVTDPGLAKLPMIADAVAGAKSAGLGAAVFSDLRPNPVGRNVSDGVAAFKAGKHDGVVAFGGGSALDVGKAVAFMAGQTRPLWDFEDVGDNWTRADADAIAPIIAPAENAPAMVQRSAIFGTDGRSGGFFPTASFTRSRLDICPRHQRNHRAASMPTSVTTPVRCVVRTTAPESRVTRLFCMPIAAHRIAAS